MRAPNPSFWGGKTVLVTGHTGFKGAWLVIWLQQKGARVTGVALPPTTKPNLFDLAGVGELCESHFCDLRDNRGLAKLVTAARPEIVFHLAAQPLVRASYRDPLGTFSTNVQGTVHVLESLRETESVRSVVAVTTDKVYKDIGRIHPYTEAEELGGRDPYSASKAAAELVIASYRDSFLAERGIAIASARAGNVIGGGDWSRDRLLPDAIRTWSSDRPLTVRRPEAVRPWQHVLDPLAGYLLLAESLWEQPERAGAYNLGPGAESSVRVREVVEMARKFHGRGETTWLGDDSGPAETQFLALDASKAKAALNVAPVWNLEEAIRRTVEWYRSQLDGSKARSLCLSDIAAFESSIQASRS